MPVKEVEIWHPSHTVKGVTFVQTCRNRHNWREYTENGKRRISVCDLCHSTLTEDV